jgi:hypothetical protein
LRIFFVADSLVRLQETANRSPKNTSGDAAGQ